MQDTSVQVALERSKLNELFHESIPVILHEDDMRGLVPDSILDEPKKVGINAPVFDFRDKSAPQFRAELLTDSPIFDIVRR